MEEEREHESAEKMSFYWLTTFWFENVKPLFKTWNLIKSQAENWNLSSDKPFKK